MNEEKNLSQETQQPAYPVDTPPSSNVSGNGSFSPPSPNPLEGKLVDTPRATNPFKEVLSSFVGSNFFRPVLIAVVLGIFLVGLAVYVLGNLGTVGGGGEIVWWGIEHDESVYAPLIAEFEKQNPNIRVKYERQSPQDYRERLVTSLSSGKGPDIFEIHNSWPYMLKNHLGKMPGSVWSVDDYKKSFYPVIYSNFNFGGGIVAIPLEYDSITLFINEDIFASSAKKPPVSWDELRDLAEGLTQKDDRGVIIQSGVALGNTQNIDYWPEILGLMMAQNKVNPIKPVGDFASDVVNFYIAFDKKTWDQTLPNSTEAFAKGKLAMYFAPSKAASDLVKYNPGIRFKTVRIPQLAKNTPTDPDFTYATYWAQGVWTKSKKSQAAWQFLKFMSSEPSLLKINENIKKSETFGRVSPRPKMNNEIREDSLLGSVVLLSGSATTSLLNDKTNDGQTGINSKINKAYKMSIDDWKGRSNTAAMDELTGALAQILAEYGISVK